MRLRGRDPLSTSHSRRYSPSGLLSSENIANAVKMFILLAGSLRNCPVMDSMRLMRARNVFGWMNNFRADSVMLQSVARSVRRIRRWSRASGVSSATDPSVSVTKRAGRVRAAGKGGRGCRDRDSVSRG